LPNEKDGSKVSEAAVVQYFAGRQSGDAMTTISTKNQITLPAQLLREIGIGPGDRLAISREGNRLVMRPRPKDWVEYHAGSLRGMYGDTPEEIEAYIKELRDETDREVK
jgi:AbrB family looped-hinge helix DNA binding protein